MTIPSVELGRPSATDRANRTVINGRAVRRIVGWLVGLVIVVHGAIHTLGAVKGLGWAEVTQLTEPISVALGVVWLVAAALTTAAGVLLLARVRWWWIVGAAAVVVSQTVIVASWVDARVGTLVNVVMAGAVAYGWASQGPHGARAEYRRRATTALATAGTTGVVTEADLAGLPLPVAAYVRRSGALGRPRVQTMHARFHGRIRGNPSKPWMTFTGEQVNTFGLQPGRLFLMDAELFGLPVEVLHVFTAGRATMRVRALSLFTMVDASGPEMDRGETVTIFNDLCILAPAALVDAPITWTSLDDHHVRGVYTCGANTVTAELTFSDDDALVDFFSDDRTAASADGKTFTPQGWSTPIGGYRDLGSARLGTIGEGHWHAAAGEFAYIEFDLDDITYNCADLELTAATERH
jgi:hypothetical protein